MSVGKRELLARSLFWTGASSLLNWFPEQDALLVLNYHRLGNPEEDLFDPFLFSATAEQRDWEAAYRVAAITAAAQAETCEISAVSSLPWLSDALLRMGFQRRAQRIVMLYDPQRRLANAPPLHLRLTDADHWILHDENYPFLT